MNVYEYYITPEEYETAKKNGIRRKQADLRVRQYGWAKERAITQPTQVKQSRKHYLEKAEANGICYETFRNRVYRYKWTAEDAATTPLMDGLEAAMRSPKNKKRIPDRILNMADENGIPRQTLFYRIRNGYDMEVAATVKSFRRGNDAWKKWSIRT